MILTSINGQTLYLLNEAPNGDSFGLRASLLSHRDSSLTDREERRGFSETVALVVSYDVQLHAAAARLLTAQLRTNGEEPVAAPIWPEARRWAERATASLTSGLYFLYRPGAELSAVFAAEQPPGWQTDTDVVVPLVVGYLDDREVKWLGADLAEFSVKLVENSRIDWAVAGVAYTALDGPNPAGLASAPVVLPFPTSWSQPRQDHVIRIERQRIGFMREASVTYRPTVKIARTLEQRAWLDSAEGWTAGKLVKWFEEHGSGRAFWAAGQANAAELTEDVPAGATLLQLAETSGILVGDYLAAVDGAVVVATFGPVLTITGNAVGFAGTATPELLASRVRIVPLVLCRLEKKELAISFESGRVARADFLVRELPTESVVAQVGEIPGQTLGKLPTRAYLYTFERSIGGTGILGDIVREDANYITYTRNEDILREDALTITSTLGTAGGLVGEDEFSITFVSADSETGVTDTFTSFERDLSDGGVIYFSRPITHGARTQGIALEQDTITLTCDGLNLPPILEAALLLSEVPCKVTIEKCEVVAGVVTNRQTVFTGDLAKCTVDGKSLRATAVSGGTFFDLKAPRFYLQAGCNHALFSAGCGLLAANWKHSGVITDPGTAGYPYQFTVGGLSRAGGGAVITAADAFAGGWAEIGAGAAIQRRSILGNTAMDAGGRIVLTLHSDPSPYPVAGAVVAIYPGCDGAATTCKGRFNNYLNHGGAPKVPIGNPSLFKLSSNVGGGGKKG